MAATAGRSVTFAWNGAAVTGVREKGIALNGEALDVTSDEDSGWQTLLSVAGQNSLEISLSGVTKDRRLMDDWFAGTRTRTASLTYPDGTIISGSFYIDNFKLGTPYNEAQTFDCVLKSTGTPSYTPGS